jgi:(E)-benzylidenesuccinyl-CoA hydratase
VNFPDFEAIEFEVSDDHVATVTLNRPDRLNAFDAAMAREIAWSWDHIRDTDGIHAAVLRAAGDRAFCSGIDIGITDRWYVSSNIWNTVDPGVALAPKTTHRLWKPVVAAVHGICAGGAQYLLNEADIIICSDDTQFFDPHQSRGTVSALEPIGMLHRGVPLGDVLRWALMGVEERITASTALRVGMVTEVVSREALFARAHDIAASIAAREPRAVQGTVRAIWESLDMNRTTAISHGMSYTQIGNPPYDQRSGLPGKRAAPRLR